MVFCNEIKRLKRDSEYHVTILILIDGFLQFKENISLFKSALNVTILILIDGFLQYDYSNYYNQSVFSHNPYFNRWFSAINI